MFSVCRNHDNIPGIEEANETTRLNSDYEKCQSLKHIDEQFNHIQKKSSNYYQIYICFSYAIVVINRCQIIHNFSKAGHVKKKHVLFLFYTLVHNYVTCYLVYLIYQHRFVKQPSNPNPETMNQTETLQMRMVLATLPEMTSQNVT